MTKDTQYPLALAHTPGPWDYDMDFIVAPDPNGLHRDIYIAEIAHEDDECRIASPEQQDANRRLIAAAPELLGALHGLLNAISKLPITILPGPFYDTLLAARKAVARGGYAAHESLIDIHALLEERRQVAVVWSGEDVQEVRPDLTDDQSWEVLQRCIKVHDCEIGFNWLLIQYVADELFPSTKDGGGQ